MGVHSELSLTDSDPKPAMFNAKHKHMCRPRICVHCVLVPVFYIENKGNNVTAVEGVYCLAGDNLMKTGKNNATLKYGKKRRWFRNIAVHLGIARLEGGSKPLPGWFVAPIFRNNVHVQTGI